MLSILQPELSVTQDPLKNEKFTSEICAQGQDIVYLLVVAASKLLDVLATMRIPKSHRLVLVSLHTLGAVEFGPWHFETHGGPVRLS